VRQFSERREASREQETGVKLAKVKLAKGQFYEALEPFAIMKAEFVFGGLYYRFTLRARFRPPSARRARR
jgi:hypothetical protein